MQILLDNQISDLEELSENTRAWDLDFNLVSSGGFVGRLRQGALPDLLLTYAQFGCKLHQAGTTPPGYRTFAIPGGDCCFWWLGFEVDSRSLLRFGVDRELAAVSTLDFSVYTLSVREELLKELAESLRVRCPLSDRGVTRLAFGEMESLRALARTAVFDPAADIRAKAAHNMTDRLLVSCASGANLGRPRSRSRDHAISRVIEFLEQHGATQPGLSDLCQIAHVSERTLQYAFRERYGLSPNQFVRHWQLNKARRVIRSTMRNGQTLASVAAACGFLDPSVFAKHYRLLHGELPSATAAKSKRLVK